MLENFCEHIVSHRNTIKDRLLECGTIIGGIAGGILVFFIFNLLGLNIIAPVAASALLIFAIRYAALHKWEYEYTCTSGEIDIDKIIAQRSRKRMVSFRVADCEIIAPYNRGNYITAYKNLTIEDYSSYLQHPDNFFAVFEKAGLRRLVVFQPNDTMLRMCKQYNPRQVFIDSI